MLFLDRLSDRLVVLDEIHHTPEIFRELRGLIDRGCREGRGTGRFLILGSASMDPLKQSSESLAGRIEYVELGSFNILEVGGAACVDRLWNRGGFPGGYLAGSDEDRLAFRENYVKACLKHDLSQFGPMLPATRLERLWTMLCHDQGGLLNVSKLAANLMVSAPTANRHLDFLCKLMLVRRLPPHMAKVRKRLVKSPRVHVRDSGLVHALLGVRDLQGLAGHPVVGARWEGFAIENLPSAAPRGTRASFYRTAAGAEMDLVLEIPGRRGLWAIEIKRGLSFSLRRGYHNARRDLEPERSFVVYSGSDRYRISETTEVVGLAEMVRRLRESRP